MVDISATIALTLLRNDRSKGASYIADRLRAGTATQALLDVAADALAGAAPAPYVSVSTGEVAEMTGLSRTTIWRMEKAGTFPTPWRTGDGGQKHYRLADMEAWMASRGK